MGDRRYEKAYAAVAKAANRAQVIQSLDDEAVIHALAAASRMQDPLLANVLATEAENRIRRLRAVVVYVGDGVASLDAKGNVRWLNPAAEALLGMDKENVVGRNLHTVVEHRGRDDVLIPHEACALLAVARTRQVAQVQGEFFVRGDRSRLCVAYTSAPTFDPEGQVNGIVVAFRDCATRQAQEEELRAARILYCSLFERLPLAAVLLDQNGTIVDVNRRAEEQTLRPKEEAKGHSFRAFLLPDDAPEAERLFDEVVRGASRSAEFGVLRGNGTFMRVRATAVPVTDGEAVRGVHCIFEPTEGGPDAPLTVLPATPPEG